MALPASISLPANYFCINSVTVIHPPPKKKKKWETHFCLLPFEIPQVLQDQVPDPEGNIQYQACFGCHHLPSSTFQLHAPNSILNVSPTETDSHLQRHCISFLANMSFLGQFYLCDRFCPIFLPPIYQLKGDSLSPSEKGNCHPAYLLNLPSTFPFSQFSIIKSQVKP